MNRNTDLAWTDLPGCTTARYRDHEINLTPFRSRFLWTASPLAFQPGAVRLVAGEAADRETAARAALDAVDATLLWR